MYQNLRKDRKITYRISSSMILGLIGFLINFFPVHFYSPGCTAKASENKPSDQGNHRHVLVLNSYHVGYEWADGITKGIREQFDESGETVDLYIEFMDTKRHSDDDHFSRLRELYKYKFSDRDFDVIISCDDNALNFLLANRENLAPSVPIVFCGVNNFTPSRIAGYENITGVVEGVNFRANIDLALELHPNLKRIVVIGGSTLSIVSMRRRLEQVVPEYVDRVKFDYLVNLSMSDLLKRLDDVPSSDVVFSFGIQKDKDGKDYTIKYSNKVTTSRCKAPVYAFWDHLMTPGVFGGYVVNSASQGRAAADLALRILRGEDADDIPVITESPNLYMFNYYQLQRFGIDMSALPESRIVLDRPFSFYETYKKTIWSVVSAFILLLSIIATLVRSIIQRKRAEEKLKEYSERLEEMVEERTQELRGAHEKLVRQEKLAVLGQLAGGVGHEMRNPLGAIRNAAYFLNMALKDPEPGIKDAIGILEREVLTSDRIISSLLDFARPEPPTRINVDINDVVRTALSRAPVPENVEIKSHLDETLPTVVADPDQLNQAFGNFILNAIQAMPEGGRLVIKSETPSPEWVAVSFIDTGIGIAEEKLGKVFEPLFTTKAKGIGLGLALTKIIVEGNEGTIEVQSKVGKGTTFTVSLPVRGEKQGVA